MPVSKKDIDDYSSDDQDKISAVEATIWSYIIALISHNVLASNALDLTHWRLDMLNGKAVLRNRVSNATKPILIGANSNLSAGLKSFSYKSAKTNEKWLKQATTSGYVKTPVNLDKSIPIKNAIGDAQKDAPQYLSLAQRNMTDNALSSFEGIVNDAVLNVRATGMAREKAIKIAADQWAKKGIPALIDQAGKCWSPDVYLRMVMGNEINKVTNDVDSIRLEEYGVNLVKISSHAASRPSHVQYQEHVYSLNGDSSKYPSISATGYGSITGIGGLNCHHYLMPYVDGYGSFTPPMVNDKENERLYNLTQQQRSMERSIREAKRRKVAAQELGSKVDIDHANQLVSSRQNKLRTFIKDSGFTRQYNRERITINDTGMATKKILASQAKHAAEYKSLISELGSHGLPSSLEEYRKVLYNKHSSKVLHAYVSARQKGSVEALVNYNDYLVADRKLNSQIVGIKTANGRVINGFSDHTLDRIFGVRKDGTTKTLKRRDGVSVKSIKDILDGEIKAGRDGTFKYSGSDGYLVVNAEGNIITVVPHKKRSK